MIGSKLLLSVGRVDGLHRAGETGRLRAAATEAGGGAEPWGLARGGSDARPCVRDKVVQVGGCGVGGGVEEVHR